MRLPRLCAQSLLLLLPTAVTAVFRDEVGHIDFHHQLVGLPQQSTTFFHRPRRDEKASLLYTLSDVGVIGAINPGTGDIVWRQFLSANETDGTGSFLRAADGEDWITGAHGGDVHAWDARSGRNVWWTSFDGRVKDLEVMELTEAADRKDVLALSAEDGAVVLRRLNSADGSVVWEFRDHTKDIPLQVSTNIEKIFVVSLHGSPSAYSLKVTALDNKTGRRVDEIILGTRGEVHSEKDVMFVGANSACPIVAWADPAFTKLRVNVLGTKAKHEFALPADTVGVAVHAPHLLQSEPHFLVHSRTQTGHKGEVYHIGLKDNAVKRAYELPHVAGQGAFSTSSEGANVWFTRITEDEVTLTASGSHGILGRWPLKTVPSHAVSEVLKKADGTFAVRSAVVTTEDNWSMVQNGKESWTRPEGLSGAVAAAWADIPEDEGLARTLEEEAHSSPLWAYIHRVKRHVKDLRGLPDYLKSIPKRFISSVLGTELDGTKDGPHRDAFGFNKLVILVTQRGRLYALDTGHHGKIVWSRMAFEQEPGNRLDVRGLYVDEAKGLITVRGAEGEYMIVRLSNGASIERMLPGSWPPIQSTVAVDSPSGPWLLPVGIDGKIGDLPAVWTPKDTIVVRGPDNTIEGIGFVPKDEQTVTSETLWTFAAPSGYRIATIAAHPRHDPVASIGRVLADRSVLYKYLNPNTAVVAAANDAEDRLNTYLLDTVSGQVLASASHEGVDIAKGVSCAAAENWFACSFFGQYQLRDGSAQSLRGYQLVVSDLYESDLPDDRGPLGAAANFSSLAPADRPDRPTLPHVVAQSFVLSQPVTHLAVTQTRQGIASRALLAYLPLSRAVALLPRQAVDPRRPVGRDPSQADLEAEGLARYAAGLETDPRAVASHEREVGGVRGLMAAPATVESSGLVLAWGVDVFGTRVAPSFAFDMLGKGFGKASLVGTVAALFAGVVVLGPMVKRKQINMRWML